ncbi:MAG: electron transfer flavoprotein subunit beta, partial [Spirochaetales bacterium]|nr:electron transfer flavoprotein subunit beta [Spirochaetales bacterium]
MKIVVCVKQVPATTEISIDPVTKRLIREGVSIEMNPFDTYALEQGILLREKHGGEVIVLSMGPKRAELTLRESIACGADSGILLN